MRAPVRLGSVLPAALILVVATVPACHQAQKIREQALADSRLVLFESIDGIRLSGRAFGPDDARAAVVLMHMETADASSWFDFRGYCPGGDAGCSKGKKDPATVWNDVAGAVGLLQSEGIRRIALVGAGMGGTASLVVASQSGSAIDAVVTLSAPGEIEGLVAGPDALQTVSAAKLFLAGNGDPGAAQTAQAFYDESGQPKRVEILTTNDHGTAIMEGSQGEVAGNLIVDWLARYVPVA